MAWAYPAADKSLEKDQLAKIFEKEGFQVTFVHSLVDFENLLREESLVFVFMHEDFVVHSIDLIRANRSTYSHLLWSYILNRPSFDNRLRAMAAGVKTVLQGPVPSPEFLQTVIGYQEDIPKGPPKKRTKSFKLESSAVPQKESPKRPSFDNWKSAVETFKKSASFEEARPHWTQLATKQGEVLAGDSHLLREHTSRLLADLMAEVGEGVLEMVSLQLERPAPETIELVRSLISSKSLSLGAVTRLNWLPSLVAALDKKEAIVIRSLDKKWFEGAAIPPQELNKLIAEFGSLAAIPLMSGDKIEGLLSIKFQKPMSPEMEAFLADLASFSPKLLETFLRLDFLHRIYKGTGFS